MKRVLAAATLGLVLAAATGATAGTYHGIEADSLEQYCARWSGNAMIGAANGLRGKRLEFTYITRKMLDVTIEHSDEILGMVLMHPEDREYTAEERQFLEESTSYGWLWAQAHLDRSKPLPPYGETIELFNKACLSKQEM